MWDKLVAWATKCAVANEYHASAVRLAVDAEGNRGLRAARKIKKGEVLIALPWRLALTPQTAVECLRRYEKQHAPLLPLGLEHLLKFLRPTAATAAAAAVAEAATTPTGTATAATGSCHTDESSHNAVIRDGDVSGDVSSCPLVPATSQWVLLLALQLLAELRNPKSSLQVYLAMLPAPPGSRISHACKAGPASSDLLLFSDAELAELQCPELMHAVREERLRLTQLHKVLWGPWCDPTPGSAPHVPIISLESFIWAHCWVRSRALDLVQVLEPPGWRRQVMLPLIDMCNHSPTHPCATINVILTPEKEAKIVELIATCDYEEGDEVYLNYGSRAMRDFLRSYAFLPHCAATSAPCEVYEDLGGGDSSPGGESCSSSGGGGCGGEALLVVGSHSGRFMALREVRLLSCPALDPSLLGGGVRVVYMVKDETSDTRSWGVEGPLITLDPGGTNAAAPLPHVTLFLPDREPQLLLRLVLLTKQLLASFPSTAQQDRQQLVDLTNQQLTVSGDNDPAGWLQQCHHVMALHYRLERKVLLKRVIRDLEAMLCALSSKPGM